MKFVLGLLASAIFVSTASAEVVFDDFTTASPVLAGTASSGSQVINPNGYRRITKTGGASAASVNGSVTGAGTAVFNLNAKNAFFRLEYSSFGVKDLHSINKVLRFTIKGTAGFVYDVAYIFQSLAGSISATQKFTGSGVPEVHGFNMGPLTGSKLSQVTGVTIRVTRDTNSILGASQVTLSNNIAAVPEPASMLLFGLTGVAGVVAARRRRKAARSAEAC